MKESLAKSLKGTQLGKELVEHLKDLEGEIYDSRNWEPGMTRETATLAAKPIRKLINAITIQPEMKDVEGSVCE